MRLLLVLFCVVICIASSPRNNAPHSQYLATVHHSSSEYKSKRGMQEGQFVGDLIFNNTVNENGEVTISLCDITQDLFNQLPVLTLFDFDKTAGVENLASAELKAKLQANVNIDGCLVFFFNPCCKSFGLKIVLDDPVVLSATGSLEVDVEAFSFGISAGSNNINFDPLNDIDLSGFSPVIGAWNLPPILDQFIVISDQRFCATFGLPGTTIGLDFCVVLNNFTAGVYGVNVCPRLTISFGDLTLFDVSYTALASGAPECLTLSFFPTCSYSGASVSPDILQLFKSADADNNQKITLKEMSRATVLLGTNSDINSFNKMDTDKDGQVSFSEFKTYASAQAQSFDQSPDNKSGGHKTYSGGDIAATVILTMFFTILVIAAVLFGIAYKKGIIDIARLRHLRQRIPVNESN